MRGIAETPDLILSGEIGVNKTVNTESLNIYENGNYTPPAGVDGYDDIHVDVRPVIDQITIRENGTYEASGEVDGYAPIVVNVPQSAAKVYAKNINANGNYYPDAGYDGFSQVSVNVPATQLRPLNVTENGEYNPPTGEGYSKVVVDVPTDPEIESITITENGTYTAPTGVDGYSPVIVNVPQPEDAYYIKDMTPGAIASFDDGADMVLPSLTASIVPVQAGSGDPSPTNVRPISGWSGCEVIDDAVYGGFIDWNQLFKASNASGSVGGITVTRNDEEYTVSGTATADGDIEIIPAYNHQIPANHVCLLQHDGNGTFKWNRVGFNSKVTTSKYFINKHTASYALYPVIHLESGVTYNFTAKFNSIDLTQLFGTTVADYIYSLEQAEAGSGVAYFKSLFYKDYYPYNIGEITNVSAVNGDTDKYRKYTIPFTDGQGQSVEVFGGSVDVVNGGEQPRTLTSVDLGTLSWSYNNVQRFFYTNLNDIKLTTTNLICDRYIYVEKSWTTMQNGEFGKVENSNQIRFHNDNYETAADFKTAMNGVQLVYELATPTTFYTQPTSIKSLDGENNIYANTGNILEGSYFSDTPA